MPMFRLFGGTLILFAVSNTVRSPNAIEPFSAVSRPAMHRSVVVLPQPLGPRRTRNSPGSISRSRSSIAVIGVLPPNRLVRLRMLTLAKVHHLVSGMRPPGGGAGPGGPAPPSGYLNRSFQYVWYAVTFAGVSAFRFCWRGVT